jgi:hypothetical protein
LSLAEARAKVESVRKEIASVETTLEAASKPHGDGFVPALDMMLPVFPGTARLKVCSKCGASFTCGSEAGREKCWCDALPHIPPLTGEALDCFCPECLAEAISNLGSRRDAPDARD